MQLFPSHHIDDDGAMLVEPSLLSVLIRTTGVPKYKMGRLIDLCMITFPDWLCEGSIVCWEKDSDPVLAV